MKICYLIYDDMTLQDLVGPMQIWSLMRDVEPEFVAKAIGPVSTDSGLTVTATHDFSSASAAPDIFFVPGGTGGTFRAAVDEETLAFARSRAEAATWVTSVCTGALILGAAGLLKGYKAATHWSAMGLLDGYGALPTPERWVIDRNRATGGGVTAGIDFGLALMAEIAGEDAAKAAQLMVEYAPAPPFDAGSPEAAGEKTVAAVMAGFADASPDLEAMLAKQTDQGVS